MIERLFDSFLINHFTNAERFDGLLMWAICTFFVWYWQVKNRNKSIEGMIGNNRLWESHEQIVYYSMMMAPPIVFKAAFVSEVHIYVWYFLAGIILFALFGRGVLDYILAFFGRAPVAKREDVNVKTETTTETTIKENEKRN